MDVSRCIAFTNDLNSVMKIFERLSIDVNIYSYIFGKQGISKIIAYLDNSSLDVEYNSSDDAAFLRNSIEN